MYNYYDSLCNLIPKDSNEFKDLQELINERSDFLSGEI